MSASFDGLPGAELIEVGLADAASGTESIAALLVAIAAPRLTRLGVDVPKGALVKGEPELALYRMLCEQSEPDPYSSYNALLRRLVSFEQALEHRVMSERRRARSG